MVAERIASSPTGNSQPVLPSAFLGDVTALADGRVHLQAGAEPVVEPDRAVGAGDFVAEVHAAAERPAHFELADGAVLVAHQADRVVLGLDRMDLRVAPAHDLDRPDVFADEVAGDLDAVAAEVDDRAAAGEFLVPEPVAVRARSAFRASGPRALCRVRPWRTASSALSVLGV